MKPAESDCGLRIADCGLKSHNPKSEIRNPKFLRSLQCCRGQAAVERLLLSAIVVAAFVAMAAYVRRAYMGYLHATASGHGFQFDPGGTYTETQTLNQFSQVQDVNVVSGDAAVVLFGGDSSLPSTPGGGLPSHIRGTKVTATTDWNVGKDGNYEAR